MEKVLRFLTPPPPHPPTQPKIPLKCRRNAVQARFEGHSRLTVNGQNLVSLYTSQVFLLLGGGGGLSRPCFLLWPQLPPVALGISPRCTDQWPICLYASSNIKERFMYKKRHVLYRKIHRTVIQNGQNVFSFFSLTSKRMEGSIAILGNPIYVYRVWQHILSSWMQGEN